MGSLRGTVTKVLGASSTVDCGRQGVFQCALRTRLSRKDGVRLAVGDRVLIEPGDGEAAVPSGTHGMIVEVEPRRTALRRTRDLRHEYIVCANVDRIFIVVAASDPLYSRLFIDRLIVAVERDHLAPVVVVNKIDLADLEGRGAIKRDLDVYRALGYLALLVSAETGEGIEVLRAAFRGGISAAVGPSGVGKSSLLNLVSPGASLLVGRVSEHDGRGRHTTTAAELVPLTDGPEPLGFVIDTPGLSDFGFGDIGPGDIMAGFREVARAALECHFKNCRHGAEPGCGVNGALESGAIDGERYANWRKLSDEITADARGGAGRDVSEPRRREATRRTR
jgi:ribosome biogenesis GTPase